MHTAQLQFGTDGKSQWAGMSNYMLISPDESHRIEITYAGEPPHGDSYHTVKIDGHPFPGLSWGCMYAFSKCSRYCVFSWMQKKFERRTVVVDLQNRSYCLPAIYFADFEIQWPSIINKMRDENLRQFTFTGSETWHPY